MSTNKNRSPVPHRRSETGRSKPHYTASTSISDLVESGLRFQIPTIQRPYVWDVEKALRITQETWKLALEWKDERDRRGSAIIVDEEVPAIYSLGAATVVDTGDSESVVDVIDGQQRITTLTCLVAALKTAVEELSERDKDFDRELKLEFVNLVRTKQTASKTNEEAARKRVSVAETLKDFLTPKVDGEFVPRLVRETAALDDAYALEAVLDPTDLDENSTALSHPIFSSYRTSKRLFSAETVSTPSGSFMLEHYEPSPRNMALLAAALLYGLRLALVAENPTDSALEHIDRFITINTQAEPLAGFDIVKGHVMRDHSEDAAEIDNELRRIYTFLENSLNTSVFDRDKTESELLEEFPELQHDRKELSFRLAEEEALFKRKPRAKVNATVDNYLAIWLHSSTRQAALVPKDSLALKFGEAVRSHTVGSGLPLARTLKEDLERIHDLSSKHRVFSAHTGTQYTDLHISNMCATNGAVKQHLTLVFALRKLPPAELRPAITAVVGYVGMHALFGTLAGGEARSKLFDATQSVVAGDTTTAYALHQKLFRDQSNRLTVPSKTATVERIKALDYNNADKKMKFILLTIENHMRLQEDSDNPQLKSAKDLDLDHIMPFAKGVNSSRWVKPVSGEEGTVTHLDSLGNLCLLEPYKNRARGAAPIDHADSKSQYLSSDLKLAGITYEGRDSKSAFSVKARRKRVTLLEQYPEVGAGPGGAEWTPKRASERSEALASMFWDSVVAPPITPLSYSNADIPRVTVTEAVLIKEGLLEPGEMIFHEDLEAGLLLLESGLISYASQPVKLAHLAKTVLKDPPPKKGGHWARGFFVLRGGEKRMLLDLKNEYLERHKAQEEESVARHLLFNHGGSKVSATEHPDGTVEFLAGSSISRTLIGKQGPKWSDVYGAGVLEHTDTDGYRFKSSYSFRTLEEATVFISGSAGDIKRWEQMPV